MQSVTEDYDRRLERVHSRMGGDTTKAQREQPGRFQFLSISSNRPLKQDQVAYRVRKVGAQMAARCLNVLETKGDSHVPRNPSKMHVNETNRVNSSLDGQTHHGKCIHKMKVYPYGLLKKKEIENGLAKIHSYP